MQLLPKLSKHYPENRQQEYSNFSDKSYYLNLTSNSHINLFQGNV